MVGDRGALAALHNLSAEHDALRFVIEGDGGPGRPGGTLLTGDESVFHKMRFEMRRLGVLERREIGLEELFRRGVEDFDWGIGVECDALDGRALSSRSLEDTMLQVDRSFACHVVRMQRDVCLRTTVFDPEDRAMVMSFCAGHPDVIAVAIDPGACVTQGPVVWRRVWIKFGAEDRVLAGYGIPCDQATHSIR